MGSKTGITWTDSTWNPIRARNGRTGKIGWHCEKVSAGCANCYAERMNLRLGTKRHFVADGREGLFLDDKMLTQPLRWKRPRMIFPGSMTDLFGEFVTDETLDRVWEVMARADRHIFQVLTKRPERMYDYLKNKHPLPNVWVGVTVEDQDAVNFRVHWLLKTPAMKRWLSVEPLLGPVRLKLCSLCGNVTHHTCRDGLTPSIDWVVVGGESGPRARPMDPQWVRDIRDHVTAHEVPFLFKQWGNWSKTR